MHLISSRLSTGKLFVIKVLLIFFLQILIVLFASIWVVAFAQRDNSMTVNVNLDNYKSIFKDLVDKKTCHSDKRPV